MPTKYSVVLTEHDRAHIHAFSAGGVASIRRRSSERGLAGCLERQKGNS